MKSRRRGDDETTEQAQTTNGSRWAKKRNVKRLGGGGLSLEAFANIKSNRGHYNPALAKKQREFYKNAKYVSKYKKTLKHRSQQNDHPVPGSSKDETEREGSSSKGSRKNRKGRNSLNELYEKKREVDEKARMEREAMMQATKEERQKATARRKAEREKMFKRTRSGQPLMKYRIEHLLQTIQGSS